MKAVLGILSLIALSVLAAEGAMANVIDRVNVGTGAKIISHKVHSVPGRDTYLLATNVPYDIYMSGTVGRVNITLKSEGQIGHLDYGQKSQVRGPVSACGFIPSPHSTRILSSPVRTATVPGKLREHAIAVIVEYDGETTPFLEFKRGSGDEADLSALGCHGDAVVGM